MARTRMGYDEPKLVTGTMSDGSETTAVLLSGDHEILFECVDQQAAENLASAIDNGVMDTLVDCEI